LEQAVELSLGILPREVTSLHEIKSPAARSLWPTPTATLGTSQTAPWKDGVAWWLQSRAARHLEALVQHPERMWPTPAARDYRAPNNPDGASRLSRPPTSGEQLPNAVGGVLNPEWVEKMMGFPPGWTDIPALPPATIGERRRAGSRAKTLNASLRVNEQPGPVLPSQT